MRMKPDYVSVEIDGSTMMVSPSGEDFHGIIRLNESAAYIVSKMDRDRTVEELVDLVLEEYDTDRDTAGRSVVDVIEKLRSVGAILDN